MIFFQDDFNKRETTGEHLHHWGERSNIKRTTVNGAKVRIDLSWPDGKQPSDMQRVLDACEKLIQEIESVPLESQVYESNQR